MFGRKEMIFGFVVDHTEKAKEYGPKFLESLGAKVLTINEAPSQDCDEGWYLITSKAPKKVWRNLVKDNPNWAVVDYGGLPTLF